MCCCVDDRSGNKTAADSLILFTSSVLTEHGGETSAGENTKPLFFSIKSLFFSIKYKKPPFEKNDDLPRQAGDKSNENSPTNVAFPHTAYGEKFVNNTVVFTAGQANYGKVDTEAQLSQQLLQLRDNRFFTDGVDLQLVVGAKKPFLVAVYTKNQDQFTKTGSGQA